jgi:hypothetical protein
VTTPETASAGPDIPFLERVKIQAEVLVPLVRAMRERLGPETADPIVREMVSGWAKGIGERLAAESASEGPLEKLADGLPFFAAGNAIDVDNVSLDAEELRFDVTGCRYADFFKSIGAEDLGYLLVCAMDYPLAKGFSDDMELNRRQTIMGGADHCDFCFKRRIAD